MNDSLFSSLSKTPLFEQHLKLNSKVVDFGGWALPVNYGSQIEEHQAVRNNCGMFDVSHMTVSDLHGADTLPYLSKLLANDISKAAKESGKALYSCMLNDDGGVIDDLIVYYMNDTHCRIVTNAGTRDKDLAWMNLQQKGFDVVLTEKPELALLAVQGPDAIEVSKQAVNSEFADIISKLKRFQGAYWGDEFVGRTGYTGEDGLEFIISKQVANQLWEKLIDLKVQPCGLGARDTLRLEAGMALYGNDLSEEYTPLESGLAWTVSKDDDRDFNGKANLSNDYKMIGLTLIDRGVLRSHQTIHVNDQQIGEITSGTFSPTLNKSIALARINKGVTLSAGDTIQVKIRNKDLNASVSKYPFI